MPSLVIGLILFFVGFILACTGAIWGLIQAFREDVVWGLLYWFVPFCSLVFYIKKWHNEKIRKTFFIQIASLPFMLVGSGLLTFYMSQQAAELQKNATLGANMNYSNNPSAESPYPSTRQFNVSPSPTQASSPVSEPSPQLPSAPVHAQKEDFTKSMKLGYAYYGQGDYQTALVNFNRALQMRPGDAYAVKAVNNTKSALAKPSKRIVQSRVK